ncbi:helix-turn-helix transcriptional regulator [Fontibacillus sp. BL9]|uniref:helix-turn-helix transcriptional regulator n=1 Tax=Fontibacillus sp. BL9 TaxID=3389971 RepID=UPI003978F709
MRADRLLSILLLLQNGGKLNSRQLAEKLEVSERTIVRDMDALSSAGIPVYAERGPLGGWMLAENYRTSLTGMNQDEILSLLMTSHSHLLGDLGIPRRNFEAAYQKLIASSPAPVRQDAEMIRERIHIDGAGWHVSDESFPLLNVVQEAVWGQRKLEMSYRKSDSDTEYSGNNARRRVHPLGLVAKRNVWYLVAEENGEFKTFRISRITEAAVREESFQRPNDFSLSGYWEQSTADFKSALPRYPATISISAQRLARLKRERYAKVLRAEPEDGQAGWMSVDIEFNTLESACEILLACGREAEALNPPELRELIGAEAAAISALYR